MAEESTLRPATDTQTLRSDGGSSRPDLLEDEDDYDEQLYEEFAAVADERDKKDREALAVPRIGDVWNMDFSIEDEFSAEFNKLAELPLNDTTSTTSHFDSIPQLCHAIGGRVVDEPCIDYILRHYPEQEMPEDDTCPPQHAARPPLSGLTNLDFSWTLQDFGASITPLAPTRYQQYMNDENRPIQVQHSQVCDAPHAFARLPQSQHGTAFGLAHSTNATDTQGAGSLPINLEDGENGEIDAGVHSEANGDDSDGDALSVLKSSPAETTTTYSEATTPYFSEPQDSPVSSPSEVAETQAGPTESSSLETSQEAETLAEVATDAQSTPSEEPSASTTAAEQPASSGSKTSSRKRRLSEAEGQPSKRPASESKVASNAVDDQTLPVAYVAPPSPAPLPAASAPADTAAVESSPPTDEETGLQEASETITTNEAPAAPSDVVSPTTAASTAPPQILLSPSGHYAGADADIGDRFDSAWLDLQLPVPPPFYHAANYGIYQPDAHGGMANYGLPSGASGPTPTPALAQPFPIHATHGLANPIIPGNAPVGVPSFTTPPVSNPGSRAPPGKNQKQPKKKKAATTTKGKGRGGAGSNNNNSGTPADEPWLGGVILAIDFDSGSGDAELELPRYDNAGPSNGSTSNNTHKEKKVPNAWACYLKATGQAGCSKAAKAAWAAMSDQDREPYQRTSNKLQMAQFKERAARRNAQSTPASSSSG